jgi:glycosyltransferase involved in cell wall biosynthesis
MYPTPTTPRAGTFVQQQVAGLRSIGIEVSVLHVNRVDAGMPEYRKVPGLVRSHLTDFQPDVVHVMYGGFLAAATARAARSRPLVLSLCGTDILGVERGSPAIRARGYLGVLLSRLAARWVDVVVVKSRGLGEAVPASFDRRLLWVIPNGVNLTLFQPMNRADCRKSLGWSPEEFIALFSTPDPRDPVKRLRLAQAGVTRLNATGTDCSLRVMRDVPYERVPVWLNAADVVLVTSLHEGSPNIVKEALACDRPVVSTDVGDVAERIEGIDGCYLTESMPEDIAEKLRRVADGPRVVDGRRRVEDLSIERVAQRLTNVYEQTVRQAASRLAPTGAAGG